MEDSAAKQIADRDRFTFGENWAQFLAIVNNERVASAEASLVEKFGNLDGITFLDIGSGSGLFSLAARNLGAEVISFDFDEKSVACARELRQRFGPSDTGWRLEQGSALDSDYMGRLGKFDVVYSLGLLHHTGQMWRAIELAADRVKEDGRILLALYNDQGVISTCWTHVKKRYVRAGPFGKKLIFGTVGQFLLTRARINDVVTHRDKSPSRGMDRKRDAVDWIGGYPFEVSKPNQIVSVLNPAGFILKQQWLVGNRLGCNEYLFQRVL